MAVIAYRPIRDFIELHPSSAIPLNNWYHAVTLEDWRSIADLKASFPTADYVGNERFVFNIGGNNYRLIAAVNFRIRTVYVKFIGTYAAYDKINASTINLY